MRHNTAKRILLACMLLYMFANASGQVTIGSEITPNHGALLDLKQNEETAANGNKGLGLPRVELQVKNSLKMSSAIDAPDYADKKGEHTGLLVYNVSKQDVCDPDNMVHGLYVWDGTEWQGLGIQEGDAASENVHYYDDTRPQEFGSQRYPYRNFGTIAGDWMLENMRYLPNDGTLTAGSGTADPNDKLYTYPNVKYTTPATVPSTWIPEQGLLYTYSAATLGKQDGISHRQDQNVGTTPSGDEVEVNSTLDGPDSRGYYYVQGICPSGWHIPSDREWNDLEREIYQNAHLYSSYTETEKNTWTPWEPIWETTVMYRPKDFPIDAHGAAMKSPCKTSSAVYNDPLGKSLSTAQGGFMVLLVGYSDAGADGQAPIKHFGATTYFWSASIVFNVSATCRDVAIFHGSVLRNNTRRNGLNSLRCKKNN